MAGLALVGFGELGHGGVSCPCCREPCLPRRFGLGVLRREVGLLSSSDIQSESLVTRRLRIRSGGGGGGGARERGDTDLHPESLLFGGAGRS